jgi:hypothetical protein
MRGSCVGRPRPHELPDIRTFDSENGVIRDELAFKGAKIDYFVSSHREPCPGVHQRALQPVVAPGTTRTRAPSLARSQPILHGLHRARGPGARRRLPRPLPRTVNAGGSPTTPTTSPLRASTPTSASQLTGRAGLPAELTEENLQVSTPTAASTRGWADRRRRAHPAGADRVTVRNTTIRSRASRPGQPIGVKFFGEEKGRYLLSGLWEWTSRVIRPTPRVVVRERRRRRHGGAGYAAALTAADNAPQCSSSRRWRYRCPNRALTG